MWFISTDLQHCIKNGGLGGLGHMFYLYVTSIIIALIFDLEHVYFPFHTAGTTKHQKEFSPEKLNWESLLNFEKNEKHISELIQSKRCYLPFKKQFGNVELKELEEFFSKHDRNEDIVFLVGNSNRINIGDFYSWCRNKLVDKTLYNQFIKLLRSNCVYKANPVPGSIVIHIRRGDVMLNREPLEYFRSALEKILLDTEMKNPKITILSLGTRSEMDEIKNYFSDFNGIEYKLNSNTIESFKLMMDAEILLGGKSSFPKVAGLYSDNKKYILPFASTTFTTWNEIPGDKRQWVILGKERRLMDL